MKNKKSYIPILISLLIASLFLLAFLFAYSVVAKEGGYLINGEPVQTPAVIISGHSNGGGLANP